MKKQKFIVDTTLRDGIQMPGLHLSLEQKLKIAKCLDDAGIYEIEAGIPAAGHSAREAVYAIAHSMQSAKVSAWNRLNEEDLKKSFLCKPDILHICVPVSYLQIYSMLKKNKTWVMKQCENCVGLARGKGYEVTVGFEDASRADITFMVTLAQQLRKLGVARIRLSDTVGVLVPSRARQLVRDIREGADIPVEFHAHNDLGMAVANSLEAAKAGADYINTTVSGMGERAGNCSYGAFVVATSRFFQLNSTPLHAKALEQQVRSVLSEIPA